MEMIIIVNLFIALHFFIAFAITCGIGCLIAWIYKKITRVDLLSNSMWIRHEKLYENFMTYGTVFMSFVGLPYIEWHIIHAGLFSFV